MGILPGLSKQLKSELTPAEYWIFVCENWLLILISSFTTLLVFANFWQIIVKQRRWQSAPLLLFYGLAIISTVLRVIVNVMVFQTPNSGWVYVLICI